MNYKEIKELQKFISLEIEDLYCLFLVKKHALTCTGALPYFCLLSCLSTVLIMIERSVYVYMYFNKLIVLNIFPKSYRFKFTRVALYARHTNIYTVWNESFGNECKQRIEFEFE